MSRSVGLIKDDSLTGKCSDANYNSSWVMSITTNFPKKPLFYLMNLYIYYFIWSVVTNEY